MIQSIYTPKTLTGIIGGSMNHTNWKITEQSRQELANGLLLAMNHYDYNQVTITLITQEAGLSRKTFYRLFHHKDEVLELLIKNKIMEFATELQSKEFHQYWDVVQLYFDFWEEHKDFILFLKKHHLLSKFLEYSYENSIEIFEYVRTKSVIEQFRKPLPYLLSYAVGGMHNMLLKWLEDDMAISYVKKASRNKKFPRCFFSFILPTLQTS